MNTKEKLLAYLEENRGQYLSGQQMAARLGLSRAAVWKAIQALGQAGYDIEAKTNGGYRLAAATDALSAPGIRKYLHPATPPLSISVLEQAASTNALLRQEAAAGAAEGRVILAKEQAAGRGRLGRSFFSPPGGGVYLSLLLRPERLPAEQAVRITTMAAVAVCEAIGQLTAKPASIKWINDIFLDGKKVCGILTEAALDVENALLDYAVLGVGINLYAPPQGFPEPLAAIAGAVLDTKTADGKNRLTAAFLDRFFTYYNDADSAYAARYREYSFVPGHRVQVIRSGSGLTRPALALALDEQCRLLVRYDDGSEEALSSGEISVKVDP